jgi:hypothetical protein
MGVGYLDVGKIRGTTNLFVGILTKQATEKVASVYAGYCIFQSIKSLL